MTTKYGRQECCSATRVISRVHQSCTGSHWDGHVVMMYSPSDSDTEGRSGGGGAGGAVGGVFAVIAAILVVVVIVLVVWWVRRRLVSHDVMTCCCTRDDGCPLQERD